MKAAIAFSLLMLLTMGAGCAKTVNAVEIGGEGTGYNWIKTDPDLGNMAMVQRVNKTREGDLLHVQVVVANQNSNEGDFIYRFIWIDGNGIAVSTPLTNWQRQTILGKQTAQLNGVAPEARITNVRLEMKRPER